MSTNHSLLPRYAILQAERTLASIETHLRRATPKTLHTYLEALADAYITRPAGHRLDNLDRALLSYQLAVRLSSLTPSLSAKLGNACFLRLQTVSRDRLASPTLLRQHLTAARYHIDTAVRAFEDNPTLPLDPDIATIYADALLCRALVYDTMYQTIDTELDEDYFDSDGEPVRDACAKRRLKRNHYISDCIESLEKLLAIDGSTPENLHPNENQHQTANAQALENAKPCLELHAVNKARAAMCLARAYSNIEDASAGGVSKAMTLLGSVEGILEGVEDDPNCMGAVMDREELDHMRADARAQRAALAASRRTTESRCVVS